MPGRRRRDRPRLDDDRGLRMLVGRKETAAVERPARDGDPDARVAVGPAETLGREELVDRPGEGRRDVVGERDLEPGGGPPETSDVLVELGRVSAPRAERLEHPVA